jgi:hypothetical protein
MPRRDPGESAVIRLTGLKAIAYAEVRGLHVTLLDEDRDVFWLTPLEAAACDVTRVFVDVPVVCADTLAPPTVRALLREAHRENNAILAACCSYVLTLGPDATADCRHHVARELTLRRIET